MTKIQPMIRVALAVASFSALAAGQVTTGLPPFGSFGGGPFDTLNNANLNVHFEVPVSSRAGRGAGFSYSLGYDSSLWTPVAGGAWSPSPNWGWTGITQVATGYVSYLTMAKKCTENPGVYDYWNSYSNFVYTDSFGASHKFPITISTWSSNYQCGTGADSSGSATANDGSGYTMTATIGAIMSVALVSRSGVSINAPINNSGSANGSLTDANGNVLSVSTSGGTTSFYDTISNPSAALTLTGSGSSSSPYNYGYTNPAGGTSNVTVNFSNYSVQTNFGCSGITEYTSASQPLISSIHYPDGTSYSFTYEATPSHPGSVTGRLASVTLPTGGTISYAYSGGNNGITCADGSTATLTRTTADGQWSYAHTESGSAWTTTVTDPQSNATTIQFQGIYETERTVYQGSTSGTALTTIDTCYNGSAVPCTSTAVGLPISQVAVVTSLPYAGRTTLKSETATFYDGYGLPTETDEYDFGQGAVGALTRKTLVTYNRSLSNGIEDHPSTVQIQTGAGATVSQTNYTYDEYGVQATSGTPQHASISGSRGNVTTLQRLVSGTTYLTQHSTYFDTGNVYQATDTNGQVSTFTYGNCGNSFVSNIALPLSLSTSQSWNCAGAVQTSSTDANSNSVTATFADPNFWRATAATDQTSAVTSLAYSVLPSASESTLNFNGSVSTSDSRGTLDGLGRTHVSQTRQTQGGSNYDSVETDYDSLGRVSRVTVPYTGTAGQTSASAPATTTTYDALSRPLLVTDGGGGTATYTYTQNDVQVSIGPAPTGENAKRRQLEYDGLGRLASVCEITSAAGSGSCGQTVAQTGYLTKYAYDVNNNLLTVTQNAQPGGSAQTRTYAFDGVSRLIAETNPETNNSAVSYVYDSDATCGASAGDLVKKVDAVGNVTCFGYDALHRNTTITYPSGSYATATPAKTFVYDMATVNGVAMANAKGRLAEAYTGASGSKSTDLGFSYTKRGETSDVYQSSAHSGGYYHVAGTYWANGLVNTLNSGVSGLPTWTTAPDGEGRVNGLSASSGLSPVLSTAYNGFSRPTVVGFGTTATALGMNYSYDGNTGRMTQYNTNVPSAIYTSTLTWNPNGSLGQLVMSDLQNTQNGQTCKYGHDDLARIANLNCGTNSYNWVQNFSYDAFGNVAKTGSQAGVSFQPTYASGTNRYASLPGGTPAYDANGNLKADGFHSYAWDADGNLTVLDANPAMVYDALDRRVEQTVSGTTSEILYSLDGSKLALLNGAAVSQLFVGLPGGSRAIYTASGLAYYQYGNWLGSERETTTPAGSIVHDGMYGPYGETYSETGASSLRNFTGQEANLALDLYDFPAREYHPIQGRWIQPDPAGLGAVDYTNPQSWNRYGYVLGNPLSLIDPMGMEGQAPIWVNCPDCTVTVNGGSPDFGGSSLYSGVSGVSGGGHPPLGCAIVMDNGLHPHMMCGKGGEGGAAAAAPPKYDVTKNLTCSLAATLTPLGASQITGKVAGIGVTANAGAGFVIGMGASLGVQLVADPKGNVGIALSGSFSNFLFGAGAMAGVQGSITNATDIRALSGPSGGLDISAGAGPAIDVGVQGGASPGWQKFVGPLSGSAAVGIGVGTKMSAFSMGGTKVWALTNCGNRIP